LEALMPDALALDALAPGDFGPADGVVRGGVPW
jgi:hypothetical protein